MRHNLTLVKWLSSKRTQITNVGEGVEKREPLCTVGGNVNCCCHCGKQYGGFSKNYEKPHDPAIPLQGMYMEKTRTLIQKDI